MSDLALIRVNLLKEVRTTFRERAQLRRLVVGLVIFVAATGLAMSRLFHHTGISLGAPQNVAVFGHTPEQMRMLRWGAMGAAAGISLFFCMGYLISSVLGAFVGEKENRTLEVLLACPLSDRKLFAVKCISVFLPSAVIGFVSAALGVVLTLFFVPPQMVYLPPELAFYALVLGLPVMWLPQIFFVGVGAAISARAETFKGASQTFGYVVMGLVFGTVYGIPGLLYYFPSLRLQGMEFGQKWLALPFLMQYGLVLLVLIIPAIISLAVAKGCFRRDRMLT